MLSMLQVEGCRALQYRMRRPDVERQKAAFEAVGTVAGSGRNAEEGTRFERDFAAPVDPHARAATEHVEDVVFMRVYVLWNCGFRAEFAPARRKAARVSAERRISHARRTPANCGCGVQASSLFAINVGSCILTSWVAGR